MKKVLTTLFTFAFASILVSGIIRQPVLADGTCPAAKPLSTCSILNPPNRGCETHGNCGLTGEIHYCCTTLWDESQVNFDPLTGRPPGSNVFCPKNGKQGIWTAFGCIVVEGTDFVTTLLNLGIGIAGGIAMLLIIFGGFQILTSAGNPERLNAGKELISSAITGLLMIVFSVFLLRIIGVDILGIPSFI